MGSQSQGAPRALAPQTQQVPQYYGNQWNQLVSQMAGPNPNQMATTPAATNSTANRMYAGGGLLGNGGVQSRTRL
jgi:hypothetical protein